MRREVFVGPSVEIWQCLGTILVVTKGVLRAPGVRQLLTAEDVSAPDVDSTQVEQPFPKSTIRATKGCQV